MSYNLPITVANGGISPALDNQTLTFIAGGTIVAGDVVAFDTSLTTADAAATVIQCALTATVGNARAIGFAAAAAVSGETVPVVVAGDVVAFDTSLTTADAAATVIQCALTATVGNARAIGFAAAAAVSGETVPVVVAGYFKSANVDGAVVAGSPLCGPVTANGRAEIASAAMTAPVFAVALAADVTNVAPVFVFRRI